MAIKGFKEIVDRKGYKVDSDDRKIFEREIGKSYFGLGNSDMIEFILFDVNENQLPQGEDGKLVRYINLDDTNISEYFIISNNNFTRKLNGASEFIVDIEKLVREAGYNNGIFKTQVTLLNRRAGSEKVDTDKLWIHEISPSRTEIRLLPIKNKKNPNLDLEKRYSVFTENGNFRDDTIYYAKQYIQNITTQRVVDSFSRIKGTQKDTSTYHSLIRKEFKIESIDLFIQKIREKFIESMNYFIDDREWNINSSAYGNPKNELDVIELSIPVIKRTFEQSLTSIIQYYLPKRTIQEENELTPEQQVTFDEVKQILKSSVSDNLYSSSMPDKIDAVVRGCMDPDAQNYNPLAKEEDGSCLYKDNVPDPIDVKGCMDSSALNYNKFATIDDGSCKYKNKPLQKTQTYYVWSATASLKYRENGTPKYLNGIEYDSFTITYDEGTFKFTNDVRTVPKIPQPKAVMASYKVSNNSKTETITRPSQRDNMQYMYDPYRNYGQNGYDSYGLQWRPEQTSVDYGLETVTISKGTPLSFSYKDELGNVKTSNLIQPGGSTTICAQIGSLNLPAALKYIQLGQCGVITVDERIDMAENANTGIGAGALGGVELDLNNQNEKALFDIVTDTYDQVNQTATKQFFEDQNNKSLEQFAPQEETRGQSTSGQSAGQGNSVNRTLDGRINDRQVNQI